MGEYDEYFVSSTPPNPVHPETRQPMSSFAWVQYQFCVVGEEHGRVPDATWLEPNIVVRSGAGGSSDEDVYRSAAGRPHRDVFDEYLLFLSTDPNNMADLGGEVEFWMGDESHAIAQSTAVFAPRDVWHGPLIFRRVDCPFVFVAQANTLGYSHFGYSQEPIWNREPPVFDEIAQVTLGGKTYQVTASFMVHMAYMMKQYEDATT